jgi:hypothetical protein
MSSSTITASEVKPKQKSKPRFGRKAEQKKDIDESEIQVTRFKPSTFVPNLKLDMSEIPDKEHKFTLRVEGLVAVSRQMASVVSGSLFLMHAQDMDFAHIFEAFRRMAFFALSKKLYNTATPKLKASSERFMASAKYAVLVMPRPLADLIDTYGTLEYYGSKFVIRNGQIMSFTTLVWGIGQDNQNGLGVIGAYAIDMCFINAAEPLWKDYAREFFRQKWNYWARHQENGVATTINNVIYQLRLPQVVENQVINDLGGDLIGAGVLIPAQQQAWLAVITLIDINWQNNGWGPNQNEQAVFEAAGLKVLHWERQVMDHLTRDYTYGVQGRYNQLFSQSYKMDEIKMFQEVGSSWQLGNLDQTGRYGTCWVNLSPSDQMLLAMLGGGNPEVEFDDDGMQLVLGGYTSTYIAGEYVRGTMRSPLVVKSTVNDNT